MKDAEGRHGWGELDVHGKGLEDGLRKRDHDNLEQRGVSGGGDVRISFNL